MRNAVIAIAGLFGLLLPACGGDGNENPPPAPGAEPKGTDRISIFRNAYDPAADLPRIEPEHAVIYMPSGNWSYSPPPLGHLFSKGAFYAVYSNGMRGEGRAGAAGDDRLQPGLHPLERSAAPSGTVRRRLRHQENPHSGRHPGLRRQADCLLYGKRQRRHEQRPAESAALRRDIARRQDMDTAGIARTGHIPQPRPAAALDRTAGDDLQPGVLLLRRSDGAARLA